jgi:osmotically-inducible protein OsmY
MSRKRLAYLGLALGAAIVAVTPVQAHGIVTAAVVQQPAPQDPREPVPAQGTKGSVAAGDVKDSAKVAVDKTGDAMEKAGSAVGQAAEATKDAVVAGARKTKDAVVAVPVKIDETWITAKIAGKINADDALEDVDVDVKVKKNVVTITGDVPSATLRDRILTIARETEGVARVVDKMTVPPVAP